MNEIGALFDDGKAAGALRTIGEVSAALAIKPHVLRYWEQVFPMLHPLKRSGGRRYYRTEDVRLVMQINQLVNEQGYTLKGARLVMEAPQPASPQPASPQPAAPVQIPRQIRADSAPPFAATPEIIARLRAIQARLQRALAAA